MEPHSDVEKELEPADGSFLDVSLTAVVDTSFACGTCGANFIINICLISPFVLASEMIECIYFKPTL